MTDKKKKKNDYTERPKAEYWNPDLCPVCGHNDFTWGRLLNATLKPNDKWFTGYKRVEARHCKRCGNVQLFADKS